MALIDGVGGAKAQRGTGEGLRIHFPDGHFLQINNAAGVILEQKPLPGEDKIFLISDKKLLSHFFFQLRNAVGNRGLRNVEESGSLGEVFYIGQGKEGAQGLGIHGKRAPFCGERSSVVWKLSFENRMITIKIIRYTNSKLYAYNSQEEIGKDYRKITIEGAYTDEKGTICDA